VTHLTELLGGAQRVRPRVRGFAEWSPRRETLELLARVNAVLGEYADHLPLTLRQIFYRLVGAHGYEKTEQAYERLGEHLVRARRARIIPMEAIRDDGGTIICPTCHQTVGTIRFGVRLTLLKSQIVDRIKAARRCRYLFRGTSIRPVGARRRRPEHGESTRLANQRIAGGDGLGDPLRWSALDSVAEGVMSGARHRRKGDRIERELVEQHKAIGIHAERYPLSGASRFRGSGHDIDIYALGREAAPLVAESKARKNGGGALAR
jgi:hypothetical protein